MTIPHLSLRPAMLAAALAVIAYTPFLSLPLLPDDYLQVELGSRYGAIAGWPDLAGEPLYPSRATSLVLTNLTLAVAGFSPWILNCTSLALHVLNTLLVLALGPHPMIGSRVAALAAIVFAVRERHHEAVVWYAALPELLVFTFGITALACWIQWIREPRRGWWIGNLVAFALALLSKESAVICVPLMAVLAIPYRNRHDLLIMKLLAAPLALVVADAIFIFNGSTSNHHFSDGTFSLSASFPAALLHSLGRGLWIWATAGLLLLLYFRSRMSWHIITVAGAWVVLTLMPYSFLTYMPRAPSRHHYWASVGFALIIAAGLVTLRRVSARRWPPLALLAVFVAHNISYLWLRKIHQIEERAAPIEAIVRTAQGDPQRPLPVRCFPVSLDEASRAIRWRLGERGGRDLVLSSAGYSFCGDAE